MPRLNAANNAITTLTASIDAVVTSFVVTNATAFPNAPFLITINNEIMEVGVINRATHTFSSILRARENTVAASHLIGTAVENRFTAGTHNELVAFTDVTAHSNLTNTAHGAVATPTANTLMTRATNGTSQVADGIAPQDIATRGQVDNHANLVPRIVVGSVLWQDLFDVDQIVTHYTNGGDTAGTPAVSGGILSYSGGTQATLLRTGLTVADGEITVNSDQGQDAGIVFRHVDNNNHYLLALRDSGGIDSGNSAELYRRVAGAYTPLSLNTSVWTRGTSVQLRVTFHGSLIEIWLNNVRVTSVIDTTFTTGGVGLRNNSTVAFRVFDWTVRSGSFTPAHIRPGPGLHVVEGTARVTTQYNNWQPVGNSRALVLTDADTVLNCNSTATIILTIAPDATTNFPVGTEIAAVRTNTGAVSFAAGSGVTIRSRNNLLGISAQFGTAAIKKIAANEWLLAGNLG